MVCFFNLYTHGCSYSNFFLPDAIFASPLCVYLQLKETSIQNTTKETFSIMLIELRNTAVLTNMLDSARTHAYTRTHTQRRLRARPQKQSQTSHLVSHASTHMHARSSQTLRLGTVSVKANEIISFRAKR